jgi:hypothetical protein
MGRDYCRIVKIRYGEVIPIPAVRVINGKDWVGKT